MDLPELLNKNEVAQFFRVSTMTIFRWSNAGKLPYIKINSRGDRRFKREDVLAYLGERAR